MSTAGSGGSGRSSSALLGSAAFAGAAAFEEGEVSDEGLAALEADASGFAAPAAEAEETLGFSGGGALAGAGDFGEVAPEAGKEDDADAEELEEFEGGGKACFCLSEVGEMMSYTAALGFSCARTIVGLLAEAAAVEFDLLLAAAVGGAGGVGSF